MKDDRLKMGRLGLLYAAYFGSLALIFPFLPIYLDLRGFSPSRIGLILAAIEGAGVAGPFVLSRLADRSGHYRLVMTLMVFLASLFLFLMDSVTLFPLVLLFALLNGFFFKPISGMADALSGRLLCDSSMNYGKVRIWGTISFVSISIILQFTGIMDSDDPRRFMSTFLIALAVLFIVMPLVTGSVPHDESAEAAPPGGLRNMPSGFYALLALTFTGNIGFAIHQAFGSLYYSEILGVAAVSSVFALAALSEIPSLFFGGRILGKLGHRRMLFIALIAGVVRLGILALSSSIFLIYASQLLHALMFGFYLIAGVNWVNRMVHPGSRALGMGLFMAAGFSGSQLVGSALGGFLLEHGGFPLLFGVSAAFPLAGMIWMLADRRIGRIDNSLQV